MVWYFIGVCIVNRTLHGRSEIGNFSSCFQILKEKVSISTWPCNLLYISLFNLKLHA